MTDLLPNRLRARGRTRRAVFALAAAVVLSTGCATIRNGPTQRVAVASDPPGAQVFIGGRPVGVTPMYVELDRRDRDVALSLRKDCYRETVLPVPRRTSKWVAGNPLLAGVPINDYGLGAWLGMAAFWAAVGGSVDWGRGGAFEFPDLVRASLERLPGGPGASGAADTRATAPGGVEPGGDCARGAPAGAGAQGKTPRAR